MNKIFYSPTRMYIYIYLCNLVYSKSIDYVMSIYQCNFISYHIFLLFKIVKTKALYVKLNLSWVVFVC